MIFTQEAQREVVFREVPHPDRMLFFWGEGKTGVPGEKPLGAE